MWYHEDAPSTSLVKEEDRRVTAILKVTPFLRKPTSVTESSMGLKARPF